MSTASRYIFLFIIVCAFGYFFQYHGAPYFSEKQKTNAGRRGKEWMISHKDDMPALDAVWYLKKLYQVSPDEKEKNQLRSIIREKEKESSAPSMPETATADTYLDIYSSVLPVLYTGLEKQCLGKDVSAEKAYLQSMVNTYHERMFPEEFPWSAWAEQIIGAYYLSEFGVVDTAFFENILAKGLERPMPVEKEEYIDFLYGLTHIVFTKSHYYGVYLDPKDFLKEKALLEDAVKRLEMFAPFDSGVLDISAEVLVSLKLLRQPSTKHTKALEQKILSLQRGDGSWPGISSDATVHQTYVATMALLPFVPKLVPYRIYCPFGKTQI